MNMRMALLLAPYRGFAARGRLSMALLAATLPVAIGVLLVVSARSAQASFLTAEARNLAAMRSDGDFGLLAVVLLMFGVSLATVLGLRRIMPPK